ncbi:hypothetical protein FA282_28935 [Pseudomonas aeruginosa]|nr:hypothetical protein [Pseudomonas aeruginosa]MCO2519404.1 hypothetical protein [Pseudomonas aeruginosa]MCO2822139.1 hypothetical protein [Pseudomonas aeruginosa]MCO3174947.1 hypothetical protein [Pseudomonas aeruginosa]MDV6546140.1 hypothetical protein [Pseudomonas aeruginosa]
MCIRDSIHTRSPSAKGLATECRVGAPPGGEPPSLFRWGEPDSRGEGRGRHLCCRVRRSTVPQIPQKI